MQNIPEGLVYLLVLAIAFLANHLYKQFGPTMEPQPRQAELDDGQTAPEPVPVSLAAASIAAATPLAGPQAWGASPGLQSQPRAQLRKRAPMGTKRNMQTAIAMATILGPCRAFEPDGHRASPAR